MELNPLTVAREAGTWDSEKAPKCGNFFVTRGRANKWASAVAQRAWGCLAGVRAIRWVGKCRLQESQKYHFTRLVGVGDGSGLVCALSHTDRRDPTPFRHPITPGKVGKPQLVSRRELINVNRTRAQTARLKKRNNLPSFGEFPTELRTTETL